LPDFSAPSIFGQRTWWSLRGGETDRDIVGLQRGDRHRDRGDPQCDDACSRRIFRAQRPSGCWRMDRRYRLLGFELVRRAEGDQTSRVDRDPVRLRTRDLEKFPQKKFGAPPIGKRTKTPIRQDRLTLRTAPPGSKPWPRSSRAPDGTGSPVPAIGRSGVANWQLIGMPQNDSPPHL